jgi:hypothetical protein
MKAFTLTLVISTLALGFGVSAAPPAGQEGGRPPASTPPGNPGANRTVPPPPTRPAMDAPARDNRPDRASGHTMDDILTRNTKLSSQVHDLTGVGAQQACAGFKNLGDCISAARASKNLGIDFETLKAKVTGSDAQSLGDAIHELKPEASARSEVRKARRQAQDDLQTSNQ